MPVRTVDAFAERISDVPGHPDRTANLARGVLDGLGNALVGLVDKGLIEQADLLIESLEPRFDDLVDDIRRLSLRLVLVGKDLLLPPNDIGIERGSIDRLR